MAYEVWREKCVEKLNGMFAIALWDEAKKELFLARDRMGQKPLFLTHQYNQGGSSVFAFASEFSALRSLPWVNWMTNRPSLVDYLEWGYADSIFTMVYQFPRAGRSFYARGRRVPPGEQNSRDDTIFFQPNVTCKQSVRAGDPVQATRVLVSQAVQRQMVSDVPLGCFLSGGIDSSVIALCMKGSSSKVMTFSIGFDDARYDETEYASRVAQSLGTSHQCLVVRPEAAEDLPKLAAVFGTPFGDSSALPTHYLSRETRRHVKVALSGDGGDELFGGYDRYRAMRYEYLVRRVPQKLRTFLARSVSAKLAATDPKSRSSALKRFLRTIDQPSAHRYESYLQLFDQPSIEQLLGDELFDSERWFRKRFQKLQCERDATQTATAIDRDTYLPSDLLTKVDRCSMLHSLEVRSPFMDHELVQFAAGLTTDQLLKGGPKRMLREAFVKDLPDFVFKRKKMGFAVPIGEWFRGELKPMLRDNLFASNSFGKQHFNMTVVQRLVEEHEQQRVDHSQRLYALLMLELWWQQQK
jgi:asparagine synthase (glutamine-hydrolysing)